MSWWYLFAGATGAWTGWLAWTLVGPAARGFGGGKWLLVFTVFGILASPVAVLTAAVAHVSG